jgi:hypothetical protein
MNLETRSVGRWARNSAVKAQRYSFAARLTKRRINKHLAAQPNAITKVLWELFSRRCLADHPMICPDLRSLELTPDEGRSVGQGSSPRGDDQRAKHDAVVRFGFGL